MNESTILRVCLEYGEGIQLHESYAESGYDDPESGLIATGDWNSYTIRQRVYLDPLPIWLTVADPDAIHEYVDNTMPRIGAILEKLGAVLEWEDEWATCEHCDGLVRVSPDSYSWVQSYWQDSCGIYCRECTLEDPEEYLEWLEDDHRRADTLGIDLGEYGYRRVEKNYESGFHPGQNDNPEGIVTEFQEAGIDRFIFTIDSKGQFDLCFSAWIHESEYDKLEKVPQH